ncbi:MAG: ribosome maturation factor RimP [Acidobacteria bacterium]|nr:ribosome maturation factor RimP [Acidobacteriota bacterium]
MPPASIIEAVRAIASRVASDRGLEVFDVQFRRESGGMVLRVKIDRLGASATAEESVSVENCAEVSRDLSAILDVEEVVPGGYTLEVSSPGLDRPLRGAGDYRRFAGRRAKIVVRDPIDGQGFFKGRLAGVEDGHVCIDADDGRRRRVPLGAITRAHLEVEF